MAAITVPLCFNLTVYGKDADELYTKAMEACEKVAGSREWVVTDFRAGPHVETSRGVESWEADVAVKVMGG